MPLEVTWFSRLHKPHSTVCLYLHPDSFWRSPRREIPQLSLGNLCQCCHLHSKEVMFIRNLLYFSLCLLLLVLWLDTSENSMASPSPSLPFREGKITSLESMGIFSLMQLQILLSFLTWKTHFLHNHNMIRSRSCSCPQASTPAMHGRLLLCCFNFFLWHLSSSVSLSWLTVITTCSSF